MSKSSSKNVIEFALEEAFSPLTLKIEVDLQNRASNTVTLAMSHWSELRQQHHNQWVCLGTLETALKMTRQMLETLEKVQEDYK